MLSLTRHENGRTVTRIIPAHAEADTRARIAEHRRFRRLSKELAAVSTTLSEARLAACAEQTAAAEKKGLRGIAHGRGRRGNRDPRSRGRADEQDLEALEQAARRKALAVAARTVEGRLNADRSDHDGPAAPCACGQTARTVGRPT